MNCYIMIVLNMLTNARPSRALLFNFKAIVGITLIRRSTSVILLTNDPMEYLYVYVRNYLECIYDYTISPKDSLDAGAFSKSARL